MSDMSAAAWATPGGILAGARDLGSAFMGYPVQLAAVRQQREQQEWERSFRGEAAARDAEAQRQRMQIQEAEAVRGGLLPPSDLPSAFQGVDPRMMETGRAVQDTPYLRQGDAAMASGQTPVDMPAAFQIPAPTHQERLAQEGAQERGQRMEYLDTQMDAMRRPKATASTAAADLNRYELAKAKAIGQRPDEFSEMLAPGGLADWQRRSDAYDAMHGHLRPTGAAAPGAPADAAAAFGPVAQPGPFGAYAQPAQPAPTAPPGPNPDAWRGLTDGLPAAPAQPATMPPETTAKLQQLAVPPAAIDGWVQLYQTDSARFQANLARLAQTDRARAEAIAEAIEWTLTNAQRP